MRLLALIFSSIYLGLSAQSPISNSFLSDINSQLLIGGGYEFSSNRISNEIINGALFNGQITSKMTQSLDEWDLGKSTSLYGSMSTQIWCKQRAKKTWGWMVGAGTQQLLFGSLANGLPQLYLRGNGPFEDKTLFTGPSQIAYHNYQFFGLGVHTQNETLKACASFQLIKSSRYFEGLLQKSTFYTAPFGNYISGNLSLDFYAAADRQPISSAWYGTGGSINLWVNYQKRKGGPMIMGEVRDMGFVTFQGVNRITFNDTFRYNGLQVKNILQFDDSLISGGSVDSVQSLIPLNYSHPNHTARLPYQVRLSFILPVNDKITFYCTLRKVYTISIPEAKLAACFHFGKTIMVEPTIRIGGTTKYTPGINLGCQLKDKISIWLYSELFGNIISSQSAYGQSFYLAGNYRFSKPK